MKIGYEDIVLDLDLRDSLQRSYFKQAIKTLIKKCLGRPIRKDAYLTLAMEVLGKKEDIVVVDVGCNIGTTALPLAARFPRGKVVAIDAHPVALSRCIENVRLNKLQNVRVIAAGISDDSGMCRIHTASGNSGGNRLSGFAGRSDVDATPNYDHISVPLLPLGKALMDLDIHHCDLLKIDVEGFEFHVLKSLGDLLRPEVIETVVCEYGPEGMRSAGHTGWQMVQLMLEAGYQCRDLHNGASIRLEADMPTMADYTVTDFLFTPAVLV